MFTAVGRESNGWADACYPPRIACPGQVVACQAAAAVEKQDCPPQILWLTSEISMSAVPFGCPELSRTRCRQPLLSSSPSGAPCCPSPKVKWCLSLFCALVFPALCCLRFAVLRRALTAAASRRIHTGHQGRRCSAGRISSTSNTLEYNNGLDPKSVWQSLPGEPQHIGNLNVQAVEVHRFYRLRIDLEN